MARAIDFEVHARIVKEPLFEQFRERKARVLALKLREVLAPLWKAAPDEDDGLDADAENDRDVTDKLTEVFDKALDVHCQLVLTGRQYECIWHAPGVPFEESNMTPYTIEGVMGGDMSTIRLTLLPGLGQVVHSKMGADFGGFADNRPWSPGDSVCLVQPLVWRGSVELH